MLSIVEYSGDTMQFDKDMDSPHKDLFMAVRAKLMAQDDIEELKKEKITTYAFNGSALCHIRTMPKGVDIGFLKGYLMADDYGLLQGKTKRMKVVSLCSMLDQELDYYFQQALRASRK